MIRLRSEWKNHSVGLLPHCCSDDKVLFALRLRVTVAFLSVGNALLVCGWAASACAGIQFVFLLVCLQSIGSKYQISGQLLGATAWHSDSKSERMSTTLKWHFLKKNCVFLYPTKRQKWWPSQFITKKMTLTLVMHQAIPPMKNPRHNSPALLEELNANLRSPKLSIGLPRSLESFLFLENFVFLDKPCKSNSLMSNVANICCMFIFNKHRNQFEIQILDHLGANMSTWVWYHKLLISDVQTGFCWYPAAFCTMCDAPPSSNHKPSLWEWLVRLRICISGLSMIILFVR